MPTDLACALPLRRRGLCAELGAGPLRLDVLAPVDKVQANPDYDKTLGFSYRRRGFSYGLPELLLSADPEGSEDFDTQSVRKAILNTFGGIALR